MKIDSLYLHQFRNWKSLAITLSPELNLILGKNGLGKTNILESIYFTSRGETFRFAKKTDLIQSAQVESLIRVQVSRESNGLKHSIKSIIRPSKTELYLQDKRSSFSKVKELLPTVLFSPESLSAIKDGHDTRRQLVDDLLTSSLVNGASLIAAYKKVLRTRNKILKDFRDQIYDLKQTLQLLESLEPSFLSAASALTIGRVNAFKTLQPIINNTVKEIFRENVDIAVEYVISDDDASKWTESEVHDSMHKRVQELRTAELGTGNSLVGPHKHDIRFVFNGLDSRIYCSQGQQRGLILSFKMAQIVYHRLLHGVKPVLLLDDVMSELDSTKQEALVRFLRSMNSQIILTSTEINLNHAFLEQLGSHPAVFRVDQLKKDQVQLNERPSI